MEITNNNNVSPQAEAQLQQPAGKAKKKGATTPEFDANLMALLSGQDGQGAKPQVNPLEAATQVELSGSKSGKPEGSLTGDAAKAMQQAMVTRANAQATAAQAMTSEAAVVKFPDVESLIQTQTAREANGTMTEAFVAGPNQPWNPSWVFGAQKAEAARSLQGPQGEKSPLADLMQAMQQAVTQTEGGGEKQMNQAGQRMNQELESALQALNGEITASMPEENAQAAQKPSSSMNRVGGEAFLSLLQGASEEGAGSMEQQNMGGNSFGEAGQQAQQKGLKQVPDAQGAMPSTGGLHAIEGGKGKPFGVNTSEEGKLSSETVVGGSAPFTLQNMNEKLQPQTPVITGHVVPGSMTRERLTSETIKNITEQLSSITTRPGGDGEMRIRMNPGNLGELTIKVTTEGNMVGLKVQASDPQAKKILEESLNSLKDGLTSQNLSLSRVDITIAQPAQSAASSQFNDGSAGQQSQTNAGTMNFDGRGGESRGSEGDRGDSAPVDLRSARAKAALSGMNSSRSMARDVSGRLNVIA